MASAHNRGAVPFRNSLVPHAGCALQPNPLMVPLHAPVRYIPLAHVVKLHVAQVPFLLGDVPLRYWLALQVG